MAVVTQVTKPANDISIDFASLRENDIRMCIHIHVYICLRDRSALHASESASERSPDVVAYSSVLGMDEDFNARARR